MSLVHHLKLAGALLAISALAPLTAQPLAPEEPTPAQAEFAKLVDSISWTTSGTGDLGGKATLKVPDGYRFTGGPGTVKIMEAYGNLTSGSELGYVAPLDMSWFAVFEFEQIGYVKDDEKDKLDADKILEDLRQGQAKANSELTRRGKPTLIVESWHTPPFYNKETKNLEWAIKLRGSDGNEVLNYKTKLLGRRGVMDVVLVCDEQQLPSVIPIYQNLLAGFSYKKDESYASFRDGDKIAEYGLTGLIVGGGLLAAAKTGLLAKFWKPLVAGVVAIGAFLKKIFGGRKSDSQSI
jgi:uncharacterized membrane-anchored protein